jgi:polyisoprenoid-binding protein YceI
MTVKYDYNEGEHMKSKAMTMGLGTLALATMLLSGGVRAEWTLDGSASSFFYVTSKAGAVSEVNTFGGLSGGIGDNGMATLMIDLATVNTAIEVRDQRMRDIAFKVSEFPVAHVTVKVDAAALDSMAPGTLSAASYEATLSMHGVNASIPAELRVIKVDADTVLVQTAKPLLVAASTVGLAEAVEELRTVANLPSINPQVVVDFSLTYNK